MTDTALWQMLQDDRSAGMEALLQKYTPLLRYIIGGILQNSHDTEDCFSEISLVLWQKLEKFDPEKGSLSAWLTAVARNTALNHQKALQRRNAHLTEWEAEPVSQDTPEQSLLKKERTEKLRNAIARLNAKEQQLFYRKYYYLQSTAQMAAELGLTERAVEGRLYRLRRQLQLALGEEVL